MEGSTRLVTLIPGLNNPDSIYRVTINRSTAELSELIKSMLGTDDDQDDDIPEIPLLEVSRKTLDKVVEFLKRHENDPMCQVNKSIAVLDMTKLVGEWDAEYIDVDPDALIEMIHAACYLDIPSLLDLATLKMACTLHRNSDDKLSEMFKIPVEEEETIHEEEEAIRKANPWIFEIN
jgi:S-phase kinase-associated protein 1